MSHLSDSSFTLKSINTLQLLSCTMVNGEFVTNVKWKLIHPQLNAAYHYFESPPRFLYNPIKNQLIKIQYRLVKSRVSLTTTWIYQLDYWHDNEWKFCSYFPYSYDRPLQCTAYFFNNFYYGSKTLVDDLREYMTSFHGETFVINGKIHSTQDCDKETFLAFIRKEHNEDFVIECEGKEFKAKKVILRARSPVFDTMLSNNNFKEARENRMTIIDYGYDVVEKMVEFLQTNLIKVTSSCEIELYAIARKYISQSFMEFTRLAFVGTLSMENYRERLRIVRIHDDLETEKLMKDWLSKQNQHPLP